MPIEKKVGSRLYQLALQEEKKKMPNRERVVDLLKKAWEQQDPYAAYAMGSWYLHGHIFDKDVKKALSLLREAVKGGVSDAMFDLAIALEVGTGVRKNPSEAFRLYVSAALHGDKQAIYEVGRCYYHGIGVTQERKLARVWLDKARELGVEKK